MTETQKNIDLTPRVVCCLREAGLNTDRIAALYIMGELDLLKDINGITSNAISKLRTMLTPDEPTYQEYRWVYRLALQAFFGEFGLSALLYAEPGSKPLIDRTIIATQGTEEIVINYLRKTLKRNEREIIEEIFRRKQNISDIAKGLQITEVRVRQIYHQAMQKLGEEETGIADDLMGLIFRSSDSEIRSELTVINGKETRLA